MTRLTLAEFHPFEAAGRRFLYLVPSAAVFGLDQVSDAIIGALAESPRTAGELATLLAPQISEAEVQQALVELAGVRAIRPVEDGRRQSEAVEGGTGEGGGAKPPIKRIPLQTLVLNVTSKCNLACKYCYEYGEDRIAEAAANPQPRLMSEEVARQSVEFAFAEAGDNPNVHITFFGGETLLNFPVLQRTVAMAREQARALGKTVDFSLTTNATLLRPEIIEWLAREQVGVTISIDGGREQQDRFRVFHNGRGSYDVVLPKIRALLQQHRSRPIGARVTLTRQNLDVIPIYRHLIEEVGFWEVGFAPVTTSWQRDWAIEGSGYETMLEQFESLAAEFRDAALAGRHHGFSNVRDTLQEIHKGMSKAYPCGAGFGLLGVATDGDVALCHRFAGSPSHEIGSVFEGVNRERQDAFLERHHVDHKTECRTCWARPICAGGCYHEAHTRYGSTAEPNLHYCTWIRRWTDTCLRIYGELAERNPGWLARLAA
jgi:uncharacterized protein